MTTPFSLYRSKIDSYINDSCIDRINSGICRKDHFSTLTALFTHIDTPRSAILNRCRDQSGKFLNNSGYRKVFWIPPFRAWDMLTIGNLSLALLWHIYRSLPQEVLADEKIIYKLGKISVTLPALTDGLLRTGSTYNHDPERHTSIMNKALPPDRKSSVSSIFSACEQISELSETFRSIGSQIGDAGNFDALVVPVTDIDHCLPEQAISLLFAIRNFICCESISFIIATDRDILANYLISLYDKTLTSNQGLKMLLNLFDDWVYLPPPQLDNMLQSLDINIVKKDKEKIIAVINKSNILSHISDFSLIHMSFHRFNSFILNSLDKISFDDYTILILLFILGTYKAKMMKTLSLLPNLEEFINGIRQGDTSLNQPISDKLKSLSNSANFSIASTFKKNRLKEFPQFEDTKDEENRQIIFGVLSALPSTLPDSLISQWIVKIVPFL